MQGQNDSKLTKFIDTLNGKEGTASHLVSVPPGPMLSEALVQSPIVAGEDGQPSVVAGGGGGFGFDFDPNEDPELALVCFATTTDFIDNKFHQAIISLTYSGCYYIVLMYSGYCCNC